MIIIENTFKTWNVKDFDIVPVIVKIVKHFESLNIF